MNAAVDGRRKRRFATLGLAGALAASSALTLAAPAGAADPPEASTVSAFASGSWTTNDAKKSIVEISGGITSYGPLDRDRVGEWQTAPELKVSVTQDFCQRVSGKDVKIERRLNAEQPAGSGLRMRSDTAEGDFSGLKVTLRGPETRTPATSTNGTCTGLKQAEAKTTALQVPATLTGTIQAAPKTEKVTWACAPVPDGCGGSFYYRAGVLNATLDAPAVGLKALGKSTTGWLWAGIWKYPEGT